MKPTMLAALGALALAACAVGPKYRQPPDVPAAPGWIAEPGDGTVDSEWWTGFGDPQLAELIALADSHSRDLRQAEAHLREARASREAVAGGRAPQLNASSSVTSNQLSKNGQIPVGQIPVFSRNFDLFDFGFDVSWELDIWGHRARQIEAAEAREQAAQADGHAVRLSLRAEIARNYIELRAAQMRQASVAADSEAQQRIADLTRQRFDAGEASRFDFTRADAQARSTAAQLPGIDAEIHAATYRLALLAGQPPESLAATLLAPAPLPQAPTRIALGLRSELLTRRPDIVAAERQLAAATADVGTATAELFPRFSLTGSIGQQARHPADLSHGASTRFAVGPTMHWPIFSGGSLRAQVRAADARAEAATAAYEQAVLTALAESETAANGFTLAADTESRSLAALDAQRRALDLAEQRYRAGEDDLVALLQAQSSRAQAERAATDAQAARMTQAVGLYKALGGGW